MQLTANLLQLLPMQTGTGKNGEWKKQDIIFETDGQYPKKVCISIFGDKINQGQLQSVTYCKLILTSKAGNTTTNATPIIKYGK